MVAAAIGASAVVGVAGSAMSASAASGAASDSANAQLAANQNSVQEQQREFDQIQKLLAPYNTMGTNALTPLENLSGANGAQAQQQSLAQLEQSPLYQSQMQQGSNAILANASATGGLRGGNTQLALGKLGTQTLASTAQLQSGMLGGMVNTGLGAATQTGVAGSNMANSITQANTALGQGLATTYGNLGAQQAAAINNGTSAIMGGLGTYTGLKAGGYF